MRDAVIACAKKYDADLVGFAPRARFSPDDPVFRIFPEVQTVIGLGFRVLRGMYRGVEEGTTYYQYTTMGVENLEETVMPLALLNVAGVVEDAGYEALPQRRSPLLLSDENATNPEVDYTDVRRGVTAEPQLDFTACAVACGLGERGMHGALLTRDYGPFIRCCFLLTDAVLEPSPLCDAGLCDRCGECVAACPGHAIADDGTVDSWRCAVYYNGANGSKNPFMPPDAFPDLPDRMRIIGGTAAFDADGAREILDHIYFYPPAKHFYRACICGRACDRACYIHLEEKGLLGKSFVRKFRRKPDWTLDTAQFIAGKEDIDG